MPDLTFLNSLSPLFQIFFAIGAGLAGGYLLFKGKFDQKKAAGTPDPAQEMRVRWEGPVGKHLELMEELTKAFGFRAEILTLIHDLEGRVRECERAIDRMPGSDRH